MEMEIKVFQMFCCVCVYVCVLGRGGSTLVYFLPSKNYDFWGRLHHLAPFHIEVKSSVFRIQQAGLNLWSFIPLPCGFTYSLGTGQHPVRSAWLWCCSRPRRLKMTPNPDRHHPCSPGLHWVAGIEEVCMEDGAPWNWHSQPEVSLNLPF